MSDPLLDVAKALRETTDGEESGAGRFTRARVLAAVRLQKRRRVLNVTFGIPLAAILIGSGAWAASGESLPVFVQRVSSALGLSRSSEEVSPKGNASSAGRRKPAATRTNTPASTDTPLAAVEPSAQESAPEPSITTPSNPPPEAAPTHTTPEASVSPRATSTLPHDSAVTERELRLYESAHRTHFVARDYREALTAWNDYLKQAPRGRFAVEASYNRALCLVRLGRTSEAQHALTPFANGAYGAYRKAEAQALLEKLQVQEQGE